MRPIVKTECVCKTYVTGCQVVQAVSELDLTIMPGRCLLLQGPSGCGKSTLLNIVGCLTRPTSGKVFLDGREVSRLPDHFLTDVRRRLIGFVFQAYDLLSGLTALENVALPLIPLGVRSAERKARSLDMLHTFHMGHRADFPVNELSGGEQQRVAVARALINDPAIVLADEPNSNVDQRNSELILNLFLRLKAEGKTIVISSHDPALQRGTLVDEVLTMGAIP